MLWRLWRAVCGLWAGCGPAVGGCGGDDDGSGSYGWVVGVHMQVEKYL
jgi:hypothetical protein